MKGKAHVGNHWARTTGVEGREGGLNVEEEGWAGQERAIRGK